MCTRVRLTGVAFLLLLASASATFAQQPDSAAAARSGARPGRGAIGGQVGSSYILSGEDYSKDAQPRVSFEGSFRYVVSPGWRWQVSPYFTWNAYLPESKIPVYDANYPGETSRGSVLTQIVGGNGQLQRTWGKSRWKWHLGGGPAVYRVVVQNHRRVIKDPISRELHQGTYLGATAELGVEHFLRSLPSTSLEWTAAYQTAFSRSDENFPSGFNGSPGAVELRFGGHYYFDFKAPKKPGGIPTRAR